MAAQTLQTICVSLSRLPALTRAFQPRVFPLRPFTTFSPILSGHSKWAKIKHDKGKADLRRGAEFSKLSREIITAAKVDGANSPRLRAALEGAKKVGMSKSSIESSMNKGLGITKEGVELQTIIFEAMGPANVSLLIDCLTDNRLRTMQNIKLVLKESGATVTPTAYLFSRKGRILYTLQTGLPEPQPILLEVFEETFEKAMEIEGVEDVELVDEENKEDDEPQGIRVTTVPELANSVSKEVMGAMGTKLKVEKVGIEWIANEDTMVEEGTGYAWDNLFELIGKLEESDDVQEVYSNVRPAKKS